jgi:hypothetical protein
MVGRREERPCSFGLPWLYIMTSNDAGEKQLWIAGADGKGNFCLETSLSA